MELLRPGYFAGLLTSLYRRTRDGRVVVRRRTLPRLAKQWFLVRPEDKESFEGRVIRAHIALMAVMVVAVQFLVALDFLKVVLAFAALALIISPAAQAWTTYGLAKIHLTDSELEPVNRQLQQVAYARALGKRTIWGLVATGALLLAGQAYVLVTDGAWWTWLGIGMFGSGTAYFVLLLVRLATADREPLNGRGDR